MSGFAGILIEPGAVPDATVMSRMARLIERHGGDGSHTHSADGYSLAHSLLCTVPESVGETQPHSLDEKTWIVGDVRLDARTELIEALRNKGQTACSDSPDVNLVLQAWHVWEEKCVLHLLGDFAFVIWSSENRLLFCARDHFGVKPFYYSLCESTFIFSNDLDAVRSHPAVSDELNEQAVCDYFAFGYNLDETCTSYSDILRIPPGHSLTYTPNNRPRLNNYRRIESASRIHYPTLPEYGEHFLEIFSKAVSDRLRTDQVTFELSGGLDSTSVAAMASNIKSGDGSYSGLGITTASPRNLSGNGEAGFAAMAAKHCGLEHQVIEAGRKEDFYQYCSTAQPYAWPFAATTQKFAAATRKHGKVLLGGQMGDVLMHASGSLALDQFRESSLPRFAIDRIRAVFSKRSIHALGIRTLLQSDRPLINMPPLPDWLKKDVIEESGAEERWKDLYYRHGRHPKGCQSELACDELNMPFWSHLFESYYHDLLCGIDCRQPFMDLRLIEFMFSVPASVKRDKKLLRHAMAGLLPVEILNRPKTNLEGDIARDCLANSEMSEKLPNPLASSSRWIHEKSYWNAFRNYVDDGGGDPFTILCPLGFESWICHKQVLI